MTAGQGRFQARILCAANPGPAMAPAFVLLPRSVSDVLPRRGRTTVNVSVNGHAFVAVAEPDGRLGHWLPLSAGLLESTGIAPGDSAEFEVRPADAEAEPELPADFREALASNPQAQATWRAASTVARIDWIHWITTAKQATTRARRIRAACDQLAAGRKRVCCFDPSGCYSRAFSAPRAG